MPQHSLELTVIGASMLWVGWLGFASGAVAGLVACSPASGFVGPVGALIFGLAAGVLCFLASTKLKRALIYDDSLDVFGVHAIGGIVGAILTGVSAAASLGGSKADLNIASQVWTQVMGVSVTVIYCAVVTFVILKVIDAIIGLRVSDELETEGLDLAQHDERGYNL